MVISIRAFGVTTHSSLQPPNASHYTFRAGLPPPLTSHGLLKAFSRLITMSSLSDLRGSCARLPGIHPHPSLCLVLTAPRTGHPRTSLEYLGLTLLQISFLPRESIALYASCTCSIYLRSNNDDLPKTFPLTYAYFDRLPTHTSAERQCLSSKDT